MWIRRVHFSTPNNYVPCKLTFAFLYYDILIAAFGALDHGRKWKLFEGEEHHKGCLFLTGAVVQCRSLSHYSSAFEFGFPLPVCECWSGQEMPRRLWEHDDFAQSKCPLKKFHFQSLFFAPLPSDASLHRQISQEEWATLSRVSGFISGRPSKRNTPKTSSVCPRRCVDTLRWSKRPKAQVGAELHIQRHFMI